MSEQIKVGDLVIVIHSCCGVHLGKIRRVEALVAVPIAGCDYCDYVHASYTDAEFVGTVFPTAWPTSWLKRIPPLSELEGVKTEEEITA